MASLPRPKHRGSPPFRSTKPRYGAFSPTRLRSNDRRETERDSLIHMHAPLPSLSIADTEILALHTVLPFSSSLPRNTRVLDHVAENLTRKKRPLFDNKRYSLESLASMDISSICFEHNILDKRLATFITKERRKFTILPYLYFYISTFLHLLYIYIYFYISFRPLCFFFHVNYSQPTRKKKKTTHLSCSWH